MVFAPGNLKNRVKKHGVFDFDNAVFKKLWEKLERNLSRKRAIGLFNRHVKHHLSDHRPLWVELNVR